MVKRRTRSYAVCLWHCPTDSLTKPGGFDVSEEDAAGGSGDDGYSIVVNKRVTGRDPASGIFAGVMTSGADE